MGDKGVFSLESDESLQIPASFNRVPLLDADSSPHFFYLIEANTEATTCFNLAEPIKNIQGATSDAGVYKPSITVLAALSLAMFPEDEELLVAVTTPECVMTSMDSENSLEKPDLTVFYLPRRLAVFIAQNSLNWEHEVMKAVASLSAYRARSFGGTKQEQSFGYLVDLHRHFPHAIAVHGLSIARQGAIRRSLSITGHFSSELVAWEDITSVFHLLQDYLHLVHSTRTEPSITLDSVFWTAKTRHPLAIYKYEDQNSPSSKGNIVSYGLWPLYRGSATKRKPMVSYCVGDTKKVSFIRKTFWRDHRLPSESHTLQVLRGTIGVVEILPDYTVPEESLQKWRGVGCTRVREIIALGVVGFSLTSCTSLLHILECVSDVIAVLYILETKYKLTHRDISIGNILRDPRRLDGDDLASTAPDRSCRLPFICELGSDPMPLRSRIVLCDFDNAVFVDEESSTSLANRTGTPMFAATDVLQPRTCYNVPSRPEWSRVLAQVKVPAGTVLRTKEEETAWKVRLATLFNSLSSLGQLVEVDDEDEDDEDEDDKDKDVWPNPTQADPPFSHLPIHDVESVYKILSFLVLRLRTSQCDEAANLKVRSERVVGMLSQEFNERPWESLWSDSFDAALPLKNHLLALHSLFQPSWYLIPGLQRHGDAAWPLLGHEVCQRILLNAILQLRKSGTEYPVQDLIPLRVTGARSIGVDSESTITFLDDLKSTLDDAQRVQLCPGGTTPDLPAKPGQLEYPPLWFELYQDKMREHAWYSVEYKYKDSASRLY